MNKLNLDDRELIAMGIARNQPLKKIAKYMNRNVSSITEGVTRTSLYCCDPMASGPKGRLEKNHEYIRYVLPKGTSFDSFSQEDFNLLMNHINSTKRPGLQNMSPYELIDSDDEDMHLLMKLMLLKKIPPDDVNLTKSLLLK